MKFVFVFIVIALGMQSVQGLKLLFPPLSTQTGPADGLSNLTSGFFKPNMSGITPVYNMINGASSGIYSQLAKAINNLVAPFANILNWLTGNIFPNAFCVIPPISIPGSPTLPQPPNTNPGSPTTPSITNIINQLFGPNNPLAGLLNQVGSLVSTTLQALSSALGVDPNSLNTALNSLGMTPTGLQTLLNAAGVTPAQFQTLLSQAGGNLAQAITNLLTNLINSLASNSFCAQLSLSANIALPNLINGLLSAGITPAQFQSLCSQLGLTPQDVASIINQLQNNIPAAVQYLSQQAANSQNPLNSILNGIGNSLNGIGNTVNGVIALVNGNLQGLSNLLGTTATALNNALTSSNMTPTGLQTLINALGLTGPQLQTALSQSGGNLNTLLTSLLQSLLNSLANQQFFVQLSASVNLPNLVQALLGVGLTPSQFQTICTQLKLTPQAIANLLAQNGNNYTALVQAIWQQYQNLISGSNGTGGSTGGSTGATGSGIGSTLVTGLNNLYTALGPLGPVLNNLLGGLLGTVSNTLNPLLGGSAPPSGGTTAPLGTNTVNAANNLGASLAGVGDLLNNLLGGLLGTGK